MNTDTQEHLRLLAIAYYNELQFEDPFGAGSPMLDCKRPFGNSGYEADILEILRIEPEEEEDGDKVYSRSQYEYAAKLYKELLTPYIKQHALEYFTKLGHAPES